jgi:hypothetical protein
MLACWLMLRSPHFGRGQFYHLMANPCFSELPSPYALSHTGKLSPGKPRQSLCRTVLDQAALFCGMSTAGSRDAAPEMTVKRWRVLKSHTFDGWPRCWSTNV